MKTIKDAVVAVLNILAILIVVALVLFIFALPGQILIALSGGLPESQKNEGGMFGMLLFTLWPVGILCLLIAWLSDILSRKIMENEKNSLWPGIMAIGFGFFYFLPIIMNFTSLIFRKFSWLEASQLVFHWRWNSQAMFILVLFVLVGTIFIVAGVINQLSKRYHVTQQ